jgi:hypothetical protein
VINWQFCRQSKNNRGRVLVNKLFLLLLMLLFNCSEGRRLKKIIGGVNKMDSDIYPEVLSMEIPVLGTYNDR